MGHDNETTHARPEHDRSGIRGARGHARLQRLLPAWGALLAGAAVGLSAYAAHAVDTAARSNLQTAACFAFGHGLALAALAPRMRRLWGSAALIMLAVGATLFSVSLLVAHLFQVSPRLAPFGGMTMMLGWTVYAIDELRR